jgi:hypothetical protein
MLAGAVSLALVLVTTGAFQAQASPSSNVDRIEAQEILLRTEDGRPYALIGKPHGLYGLHLFDASTETPRLSVCIEHDKPSVILWDKHGVKRAELSEDFTPLPDMEQGKVSLVFRRDDGRESCRLSSHLVLSGTIPAFGSVTEALQCRATIAPWGFQFGKPSFFDVQASLSILSDHWASLALQDKDGETHEYPPR